MTELGRMQTLYQDAYFQMVNAAKYRPGAPSDGFGNIALSARELEDPACLEAEAVDYAKRLYREETSHKIIVGLSHDKTARAFAYTIEAARCLCAIDTGGVECALKLLNMAAKEVQRGLAESPNWGL